MTEDSSHSASQPKSGHAVYLLGLLLLLFVLVPVLQAGGAGDGLRGSAGLANDRELLQYVVYMVLIVAAVTVAQTSRPWLVVLLLMVPIAAARLFELATGALNPGVDAALSTYVGLALLYVVFRGLRELFSRSRVTANTIATAICAYILMGLAWMFVYAALVLIDPHAFGDSPLHSGDLFYFSFVTLTTLGYGDISPVTPTGRSLAIVEAIIGQMYVAVVLARLVGMYFGASSEDADDDQTANV